MSFDIYGNNLKRGHCEVHSHIAEEYPCSVCMQESQLKKVASNAQLKQWELEDLVQVLESRIKELENTRTQSQWISEERLKELCESYAKYSHLAAVMRVVPNYQNWLIEQGLSNPLAPPKVDN